jgi:threonylcarbamoyladenosine tRNA methylthiotransferase MtaB
MKIYLDNIGCRLNQSEMESLARQLLAAGHKIVTEAAAADTAVINTCAVTAEAAKDARSLTRRIHRTNRQTEILLTGCYATVAPQELASLDGVAQVIANNRKNELIQILDPQASDLPVYELEPVQRDLRPGTVGNTRAFVKVQDGCDNRCTFCVTTIARGDGVSRSLGEVVAEIQALSRAGYQEAVLTGVHLGSYGRDRGQPNGLYQLAAAILAHTDIPRLRLSSLEPWDIAPGFFELWQNPRLLPHLHLPLQAGSDTVLRRMARRTSQAAFRELVAEARAAIPNLNVTTDLIVGFPGETETEFAETLAYAAEIGFGRLHAFTYSARPGTAAARMPGQLPKAVKKARMRQLLTLGGEMSLAYHRQFVGQAVNVLWEQAVGADNGGLRWSGYSGNYIRVTATGPADLFNRVTATMVTAVMADGATGEIAEEQTADCAD